MVTSLASAITQRKVKKNIAMTGEITLRVEKFFRWAESRKKFSLPNGAGIKEIILSEQNKKDLEEIKDIYIEGLKFHFVKNIIDVLDHALLKTKVENAIKYE